MIYIPLTFCKWFKSGWDITGQNLKGEKSI